MMFFGSLLVLLGLGGVAYALGWRPGQANDLKRSNESAMDILKKRYARGEITREEYLAMREDLAE